MTFDEAVQLASTIREQHRRLEVIAIGRFVSPEELDATPESWGVSVRVDRGERRKVLWSLDDLLAMSESESPQRPAVRKPKPAAETPGELLLF